MSFPIDSELWGKVNKKFELLLPPLASREDVSSCLSFQQSFNGDDDADVSYRPLIFFSRGTTSIIWIHTSSGQSLSQTSHFFLIQNFTDKEKVTQTREM